MAASWAALLAAGPISAAPALLAVADGSYFSIAKIITMFLFALPWLYAAPWVYRDSDRIGPHQRMWVAITLGIPAGGWALWLLVGHFGVGLGIYAVLTCGALLSYVLYRNPKVEPRFRILTADHFKSLVGIKKRKLEIVQKVRLYDSDMRDVPVPDPVRSDAATIKAYNAVQELLNEILARRASETVLGPVGRDEARARLLIDGVASTGPVMPLAQSERMIQFLKRHGGMDPAERRRPQDGHISADRDDGRPAEIGLSSLGTTGGQKMLFRVMAEAIQTDIRELGMSPDVYNRIVEINRSDSGLIIVAARPGNGATSTLYSLLRQHDAFIHQLVTLEAKPAADLENITQNAYGDPARLPEVLASVLRRGPDVVMVDQCPDSKTARLIAQAAESKLMLLGVVAPDSFTALAKWVKACGDAALATNHLHAVLCQVLLRRLCLSCREAYTPDPQLLAKANIPAGSVDKFYRPPTQPITDNKGNPMVCPSCQNTRYRGRTAAFELLEINDELRKLIVSNASLGHIKAVCRKNKMLYLQEQALQKVIEGVTSIQEVIRVSQPSKK